MTRRGTTLIDEKMKILKGLSSELKLKYPKLFAGSRVNPTKLFFLCFFFFGVKLGHFTINIFFLYVTKTQAYQQ